MCVWERGGGSSRRPRFRAGIGSDGGGWTFCVAEQAGHGADAFAEPRPALAEGDGPAVAPRPEPARFGPATAAAVAVLGVVIVVAGAAAVVTFVTLRRSVPPPAPSRLGPLGLLDLAQLGLLGRDAVFVLGPLGPRLVEARPDPQRERGRDRVELVRVQRAGRQERGRGRGAEDQVGDELETESGLVDKRARCKCARGYKTEWERRKNRGRFKKQGTYAFDRSWEFAQSERLDPVRYGPEPELGRHARQRVDLGPVGGSL